MADILSRLCHSMNICYRFIFILLLVYAISFVVVPKVNAQLDYIDLGPLPKSDFDDTDYRVGPDSQQQDDSHGPILTQVRCGCYLTALSQVMRSYNVKPWFPVYANFWGLYEAYDTNINPRYLHLYLKYRAGESPDWGYIPLSPGECSLELQPYALKYAVQPDYEWVDGYYRAVGITGFMIRNVDTNGIGAIDQSKIDDLLKAGHPTIITYKFQDVLGEWFLHAELITGWNPLNQQYLIGGGKETVAYSPEEYEDWKSRIVSITYLEPVWAPFRSFIVKVRSPIELVEINPDNQRTGFDPDTNSYFREDPLASYYTIKGSYDLFGTIPPGETIKILAIDNPAEGIHRLQALGTGDGPFTLEFSNSETALNTVNGVIAKGEKLKYELNVSKTGISPVSEVSDFTPEARAGNDLNGLTDIPIQFDGSRSYDIDGSIVSYIWDFGDGTTATGIHVSHVYRTPGNYTVKLTVKDDANSIATDTLEASIILSQRKPIADPSGPYLGYANSSRNWFDGSKSFDPNGDMLTGRWDFGDGSPQVTQDDLYRVVSHIYTSAGKYNVTLVVNDGIEDSEPATTTIEVLPQVSQSAQIISVSPACGQPGTLTNIEINPFYIVNPYDGWNFGIESSSGGPKLYTPQETFMNKQPVLQFFNSTGGQIDVQRVPFENVSLLFTSPILFSAKLNWVVPSSSMPEDYFIQLGDREVVVGTYFTSPCPSPENHIPEANAGGPFYSGTVGIPISLDGSLSTDQDGDPLTYIWDFGDRTNGTGVNPQHIYAYNGTYLVQLIVNDSKVSSIPIPFFGTRSFAMVRVSPSTIDTNRPPVANDQAAITDENTQAKINLTATDPDGDTLTFIILAQPTNGTLSGTAPNLTYTPNANFYGQDNFTFKANDSRLDSNIATVSITVNRSPLDNIPPTTTDNSFLNWQNVDFTVSLSCIDNSGGSGCKETKYRIDTGAWQTGNSISISTEGDHIIEYYSIDNAGNQESTKSTHVKLDKTSPIITINPLVPYGVYPAGMSITYSATDSLSGIATATGNLINATGVFEISSGFTPAPGVYTFEMKAIDIAGNTAASDPVYFVVYDPTGGFVTGGGWINSPAGAYMADLTLSDRANFGFVSKYKKGANVPTGETEFQFKVANLNFHSENYEWLVVAGARAQYKGNGTINGTGNYGFILTAIDGAVKGGGGSDKFRIKIWDKNNGDTKVYDNQLGAADGVDPTTIIQGGSIVIHG